MIIFVSVGSAWCEQVGIARIEQMPNLPQPYHMRDWRAVAHDFDAIAYHFDATGEFLPLGWWDRTHTNIDLDMVGMPSYVGDPRMTGGFEHEAINCLAAVIGASLAGIDKSDQNGMNWVDRCAGYFVRGAESVFQNKVYAKTGYTFWYELFPNILAFQLMDLYPESKTFAGKIETVADRWYQACIAMGGKEDPWSLPDFNHTAFSLEAMRAIDNGKWSEPDSAAAIAWLEYMAYCRTGSEKYLIAADWSLQFLEYRRSNPFYEVLLPYGAYTAARMNAELGRNYDVQKIVSWCFEPSDARYGWGITAERWGDYDCHGLVGSLIDGGGYAFAMNTYDTVGALVPMVRYDDRYARTIGKWVLNAANASRLFYANGLPDELQTCEEWARQYDPNSVFTYEGIRKEWKGKSPYAMGDPLVHGWANTDFAVYGSSHVGIMGGIIQTTSQEAILQLDCLRTDYFRGESFPTYLYYNPYPEGKVVSVQVGETPKTLYDAVDNRILESRVVGKASMTIPPDSAILLSLVPVDGEWTYRENRTLVNGIVVDYNNGRVALSASEGRTSRPEPVPPPDESVLVKTPKATIQVDGDASDWSPILSDTLQLSTHGKGNLKCNMRFAWDEENWYILVEEAPGDTTRDEAPVGNHYARSPWNYDGVSLFIDLDNSNDRESVGDVNIWFGLSSEGRGDLYCVRSHIPGPLSQAPLTGIQLASRGTLEANNRVVEAAIPWDNIAQLVSNAREPDGGLPGAIKPGLRFGCDPMLLDDGWETQTYIGGEERPSGRDANSRDILLIE